MGSHCESQPDVHARRVPLDRHVDELPDAGELDDATELGGDLLSPHAEHRSTEEDVLAAGQLRVKPGSHFDQRREAAVERDGPFRWCRDA
jgi:hypothetical protein